MSKDNNGLGTKKGWMNLFSFIVLIIAALLIIIRRLLPVIGVDVTGSFFTALDTIKDLLLLIVIGVTAYAFVRPLKKGWKIVYAVAIVVFAIGIILAWI